MNKKIKICFWILQIVFVPLLAYAAGKASIANTNQTAIPMAGVDSSGNMVVIKTDSNGVVQMNCIP